MVDEKRRAYNHELYMRDRDRIRAVNRLWYQNNPEKVKEQRRRWREKNRERKRQMNKEWYDKNPEKVKAMFQKRYKENPEKCKANSLRWSRAHPERQREFVRNWTNRDPVMKKHRQYKYRLQTKFQLTTDEYEALLKKQKSVCAICGLTETALSADGKTPSRLAVDHDHETGVIRGLLCSRCNKGLGYFRDNPKNLSSAIKYLKRCNDAKES